MIIDISQNQTFQNFKFQINDIKGQMLELPEARIDRYQEEFNLTKQQASILAGSKELAAYFEEVVQLGRSKNITSVQIANFIINRKVDIEKMSAEDLLNEISSKSEGVISDEGELEKICQEVINENQKSVEDFKAGKENAIQSLIGGIMRKTAGKADAGKVSKILRKVLE